MDRLRHLVGRQEHVLGVRQQRLVVVRVLADQFQHAAGQLRQLHGLVLEAVRRGRHPALGDRIAGGGGQHIRIGQLHDGEILGLATLARIHLRLVGNNLETAERQKAAFETARRMNVAVPLVPLILAFGGRVRLD